MPEVELIELSCKNDHLSEYYYDLVAFKEKFNRLC